MANNRRNIIWVLTGAALFSTCILASPHPVKAAAKKAPAKGGAAVSKNYAGIATSFTEKLTQGQFAQAANLFDPTVKAALPAPKLKLVYQQLVQKVGAYKRHRAPRAESLGPHTIMYVPVEFGNGTIDLKIVFSGTPRISGFFVEPHREGWQQAAYVQPDSFTEKKVKIGSGQWQLDGVLAVPKGNGPFPAAVLVHGSGPQDMDETLGPNKPFRDLAHGLASKGIAVLRYDKRTKQHNKLFMNKEVLKTLTVKEETVDDVIEAVKVLRNDPKVDKAKIIVIGHSLGAMLVPRIAAADADIDGFVAMAGSNEPLEDAIVRQSEYIAQIKTANGEATKKQLPALKSQAEKIKSLSERDLESGTFVMGASAAYWLDLKKHNPLEELKSVDRPILFLQGGRDYQVTADGDFARWQAAAKDAGKEGKHQFKLYPSLNHLFSSGTGKCTPEEYLNRAGNVHEDVIRDISAFVKNLNSPG